jgi:hypothetical protein
MTLLTLLKPRARPAIEPAEAIARRLGMGQKAEHFVHEVWTYPPTPEGLYQVELVNRDTGHVDLAMDEDPAEAWRRLAEPFADDL